MPLLGDVFGWPWILCGAIHREVVSALLTEEYFRERGRRSNRAETLRILERAGKGNPPAEGRLAKMGAVAD
jgi:hypothetical protein